MTTASSTVASSFSWVATTEHFENWSALDFADASWKLASELGTGTKFGEPAKAIWAPAATDSLNSARPQKVYFRTAFEIAGLPVSAAVQLFVDDSYKLFFNGEYIDEFNHEASSAREPHTHNLSGSMRSGKNVLAIEVTDSDNSGGGLEAIVEIKNLPDWSQMQDKN